MEVDKDELEAPPAAPIWEASEPMTDFDIAAVMVAMPGGTRAFGERWGLRDLVRAVEKFPFTRSTVFASLPSVAPSVGSSAIRPRAVRIRPGIHMNFTHIGDWMQPKITHHPGAHHLVLLKNEAYTAGHAKIRTRPIRGCVRRPKAVNE